MSDLDLVKALVDGAIERAEEAQRRRRVHWTDVAKGARAGLAREVERRGRPNA